MSVAPTRDIGTFIATEFRNAFWPADDGIDSFYNAVGQRVMRHHAQRPFTADEWHSISAVGWNELKRKGFPGAPWNHTMARLTVQVARATQKAIPIPGREAFQPITVRLQDGSEVVLSAHALKSLFQWADQDPLQQLGITIDRLDLSGLPPGTDAIMLAFMQVRNEEFSADLLAALLKCAGEWRSRPLEVRLVMDWAKALYREDAGSAAAVLCSGLEELRQLELLQLPISKLWGALACGCTSWVQEIAEAIDQQGLAGTLPDGSPFRPVHFIGPGEERRVVAFGCAQNHFGELPDLDVLGAYGGGFDVSHLSRAAYDALCNYLQDGISTPASLPLLPELFALAHQWNAGLLREALVRRYDILTLGGFDVASWQESLRITAAILPMIEGDDRYKIAWRCVASVPWDALVSNPERVDHITPLLAKLPQDTVDDLLAICAVRYLAGRGDSGTTSLRLALLSYVLQRPLEAFEESARGEGFVHLLPFMEQCLLMSSPELESLLFRPGRLWEFFATPREQFEPAVRSLLLAANVAFIRLGRQEAPERLLNKVRRYFTADAVRIFGREQHPSQSETVTTFVQELRAAREEKRLPSWLERRVMPQPTEAETAAMELLERILSSSDFLGPLRDLAVKGTASGEYRAIMEALPRIAGATGHVEVIIQLLRFYTAAVDTGLDVKESFMGAYRELHDLLPPTRWYEVDSWYPYVTGHARFRV